jgi:5-methylcytosine-specific restriction enzyme subunit McrC
VTIPIRNLYYLFLYAWARFPAGALREVGVDESPDLPNLLANLLSGGTRRLVRRGLDRGYRTFTDEIAGLRGRLRLDRMVKAVTKMRGTAICDVDELNHDILLNQILKATLIDLARCEDVDGRIRHDLRSLARRFYDVSGIRLSANHFRRIATSRNNREYIFLIQLCEFVFWSLMPDERGAGARFKQVLKNDKQMSYVFEDFVRNFFELHRTEYRVRKEYSHWNVSGASEHDIGFLPRMETDVTLRHPDRIIIIDAKYYSQGPFLRGPHGDDKIESGHLYQLITYLQHERIREPGKGLAGMLLYAAVDKSVRLKYELLGIPVLVATVDLSQDWLEIETELHDLLDSCARASVPADGLPLLEAAN